jgi:hypothetical protein
MKKATKQQAVPTVGENAVEKVIRLLKQYNEDLVKGRSNIEMRLEADGSGKLIHVKSGPRGTDLPIFNFSNVDVLLEFLQADELRRVHMILGY